MWCSVSRTFSNAVDALEKLWDEHLKQCNANCDLCNRTRIAIQELEELKQPLDNLVHEQNQKELESVRYL